MHWQLAWYLVYPLTNQDIPGSLVGSIGWYYKASGDATVLADASALLKVFGTTFVKQNVFTDVCEPSCKQNEVQPKGTAIRGLGYYASLTNVAADKALITSWLKTSTAAMIATCDSSWNCGAYWSAGLKVLFINSGSRH
jgi:Glycosyl hydrolase family 76